MAKVKYSKTELKRQRDLLKQFRRFLPTLQLKKQQLQMEMRKVTDAMTHLEGEERAFRDGLAPWREVFGTPAWAAAETLLSVRQVRLGVNNIAGVDVPVYEGADVTVGEYDLGGTPVWLDAALDAARAMLELRLRRLVLDRQYELLQAELRTTTQRVNLFEKVKIPESRETIRRIQIYLGDQQTAAVGRAKIAKGKLVAGQG